MNNKKFKPEKFYKNKGENTNNLELVMQCWKNDYGLFIDLFYFNGSIKYNGARIYDLSNTEIIENFNLTNIEEITDMKYELNDLQLIEVKPSYSDLEAENKRPREVLDELN